MQERKGLGGEREWSRKIAGMTGSGFIALFVGAGIARATLRFRFGYMQSVQSCGKAIVFGEPSTAPPSAPGP